MQIQNTNKIQNKHGIKLICMHVSKCVSWLVLIMLGVDLISHVIRDNELVTNSYQLIFKHVIMTMR
jgi:hypothetical protein